MLHDIVLVLVGAAASGVLGTVAWFWQRTVARKDDRRQFLRSRMDHRDKGFEMLLAACDALQFMKAASHLAQLEGADSNVHSSLATQALVLYEDGVGHIRSNVGEMQPLEEVLKYINWVLLDDHPPGQAPGVYEFARIRQVAVQCKRIYQEQERLLLSADTYQLDDSHEYKELLRLAAQSGSKVLVDAQDGTFVTQLSSEAMAEWINGGEVRLELWRSSRDVTLERLYRSGLFNNLPDRFS